MIKINTNVKGDLTKGKHCFICKDKRVLNALKRKLGRENQDICLKIFYDQDKKGNWGDDPKDGTKKNTTIKEATQIQNICWYHGLAPRVYQILKVQWQGKVCDAQVTDFVEIKDHDTIKEAGEVYENIESLGKEYGWVSNFREWKSRDSVNGKFLDFQTFNLAEDYKEKITEKYREFGTYGKKYYHNISELGLTTGPRENDNRIKWLGLDKLDFKEKEVLDLGCAGGFFDRYIDSKEGLVIGLDNKGKGSKDPTLSTFLVNNYLEKFNIDVYDIDLSNGEELEDIGADIILLLSMTFHIGVPDYLPRLLNPGGLLIVEDNSKERDALAKLTKLFSKVEYKGKTTDRDSELPIYYCYK